MADPICRWRNPYIKTVRELITVLPKEDLAKDIARQQTSIAFGSDDFFRTPYQLAAQFGLYYEDELILHTRFHYNPHAFEIIQYSNNWFKNYYVPNPYTARGFDNIQPKILNVELSKLLFRSKTELDWPVVKMELFGEEIGNDDILKNVINTYSQLYQVKNNKLKLKDGIVYEDLQSCIYEYTLPSRGDKKGFFDYLGESSNVIDTQILPSPKSEKLISFFVKWLNANPKNNYYENDYDRTLKGLEKIDEKYTEAFGRSVFDVDFDNIERFTKSLNDNIKNENTSFWLFSASASNHQPRAILNENNYQRFLRNFQQKKNRDFQPKNTIYYGAPGTGKSYRVDQIVKDLPPKFYQRITFHPEFDNASFVGGYKPFSEKNSEGEDVISYKFVPQAFASIYADAWKDLNNDYYLVIEEINRGNCAEIFGEIFQLLDRNSNYTVTPSKELNDHLIEKFDNNKEHEGIAKGLILPSNLHILATMNTSDQSLFPMDSAFKRRWEWEYVPICYHAKNEEGRNNESFNFEIDLGDGSKYEWIDFIAKINNNHIKTNQALGMDKCIGNYFIKPDDTQNITLKPFINKVIFYLWNDVFKDEDNKVFESNGSYEDFFPILTNGLTKVKELFERIELTPISAYSSSEEGHELGQAAEENKPYSE